MNCLPRPPFWYRNVQHFNVDDIQALHEVETAQGPLTVTFCGPCSRSKPINKNETFRARAVIASWPAPSADPCVHDMGAV
jgi:hypothetical protein